MTRAGQPKLMAFFIAALAALGALKLGGALIGLKSANAQQVETPATETNETPAASVAQTVAAPDVAPAEVERRILERLAARRAALDAREEDIALREAVIAAAETKLARQFDAFEDERAEIEALRAARDAAATEEVEALVSAYEKMKARDAAAIFNELDDQIMLAVASNMRTQALAGVLAEMNPAKARALTVMLAERGALAPSGETGAAGQ